MISSVLGAALEAVRSLLRHIDAEHDMNQTFARGSSFTDSKPQIQRSGLFGLFSLCFILEDGPWLTRELRRKLSGPADEMIERLQSLTKDEIEELIRAITQMGREGCLAGSMKVDEVCRSLQALAAEANVNDVAARRAT